MQGCGNSSANALELPQSCTKSLSWSALVQVMVWRQVGFKPLPELMIIKNHNIIWNHYLQ